MADEPPGRTRGGRARRPPRPAGWIAGARGRFGDISVRDERGMRSLWCGRLCHGAVHLQRGPGDDAVPGPIPEGSYPLGWMLALVGDPDGHVLMGGLGAGAGVTMLLHEFPGLRITAVEIDPAVTRLACAHFPLLARYRGEGRLTIVTGDVVDVVRDRGRRTWSVALLDTYRQDSRIHCPVSLLRGLRACAGDVWLNVLDDEKRRRVDRCRALLRSAGWTPRTLIPSVAMDDDGEYFSGNCFLGTTPVDPEQASDRRIFATDSGDAAASARLHYAAMLALLERLPEDGPTPPGTSSDRPDPR